MLESVQQKLSVAQSCAAGCLSPCPPCPLCCLGTPCGRFDVDKPTALLAVLGAEQGSGNLRLQISDAVLCSGAPCCGGCWAWVGVERAWLFFFF